MALDKFLEDYRERVLREAFMSDEFLEFVRTNREPLDTLYSYYRCAIMEVETKFKVLNEQFSLQYDRNPIETIKTRLKSEESLIRKIRTRGIPLTVASIEENITDIAGVRVICAFTEDIYMLADCLLQQDDVRLITRKDYIKNPKESGYRSLHLIVEVPIFLADEKRAMKVEVQLRTIAMDFWASLEHKLRYKKDLPEDLQQQLAAELLDCARLSASLDERMQAVKHRIVTNDEEETHSKRYRLPVRTSALPALRAARSRLQSEGRTVENSVDAAGEKLGEHFEEAIERLEKIEQFEKAELAEKAEKAEKTGKAGRNARLLKAGKPEKEKYPAVPKLGSGSEE